MDASVNATKKAVSSCGSTGHSRCGEAHKQVVSFCCGGTGHSRCGEEHHKPVWPARMRDKSLRRSNPFSLQVCVAGHHPSPALTYGLHVSWLVGNSNCVVAALAIFGIMGGCSGVDKENCACGSASGAW